MIASDGRVIIQAPFQFALSHCCNYQIALLVQPHPPRFVLQPPSSHVAEPNRSRCWRILGPSPTDRKTQLNPLANFEQHIAQVFQLPIRSLGSSPSRHPEQKRSDKDFDAFLNSRASVTGPEQLRL